MVHVHIYCVTALNILQIHVLALLNVEHKTQMVGVHENIKLEELELFQLILLILIIVLVLNSIMSNIKA